jgi:aldehyde:ferredoxin oxidoreductase
MHGFYGRMLSIDLSSRTFFISPIEEQVLFRTLGGKGLGSTLLLAHNPQGVDPLEPDNHLIFATGPVAASRVWGGCRYGVFTKSPQTGCYAESYSGGKVPEAIDSAGYDAVVLHGRASSPVALSIHPQGCEFHDAADLWGLETYQAEDLAVDRFSIRKPGYRRPGAVVIGPAGENLVCCAVIENDYWRSAGRTGTGAVMGSKNCKAIVFQGDCKRTAYDPEGLAGFTKAFVQDHLDHPGVKAYKNYGTTMMVAMMNNAGAFPARYWSQGTCDHWENLSGERYRSEHDVKAHACLKCFMACGRMATLSSGRHKGLTLEGPEYETIYAFGGLCMIEAMDEVAHLNDLCDRLGLDTITAGNLCAFAIEASRQGRIQEPIDYGDASAVAGLVQDISARQGLGAVLAQGIRHAAREWDMEDQAVHVKGLEPAGYDPRKLKGMGLSYATSDRGACHLRTTFYKPELAGMIPPDQIQDKAELLIDFEDRLTIFDALILCRFYRDLYTWEKLQELISLTTGLQATKEDLQRIASRITDMTRAFNLREGLTHLDDTLPEKILTQPLPTGESLTREELETMLQDYYRLRGWDSEGRPKSQRTEISGQKAE